MKSFGVVARPKAPVGYVGVCVNMYKLKRLKRIHAGGAYANRKYADNVAKSYRIDCIYVHVRLK
jgi:hypothetical protein